MTTTTSATEAQRSTRIDALVALAKRQADSAKEPLFETFLREYFRRVDVEELTQRETADLLQAARSHWQFGAQRTPGQPALRLVHRPRTSEDRGAGQSVLEIVNDDMPFLVDSASLEIHRQGLNLHLIVHPIYAVARDAQGQLTELKTREQGGGLMRESWMRIEIDRVMDAQQVDALLAGLRRVLGDVRVAVEDWKAMLARLSQALEELTRAPAPIAPAEVQESRAFLQWLADDHFTLLGYRCHDLAAAADGQPGLRLVAGSGLGVLREQAGEAQDSVAPLTATARALACAPTPVVMVAKANLEATVHRAGYTDYIGVKRYDAQGRVIGEHRFIGLFTSTAYSARVGEIPLLRGKVRAIAERAGLVRASHLDKALQHILETFPRDDLFQMPPDDLYETALGILALGERQRLRLFVWRDPFDRFFSCLIFMPREAYATDVRRRFQRILLRALHGRSAEFDVLLGGTELARIHFTVRTLPGPLPAVDRKALESELAEAARRWEDALRDALVDALGDEAGLAAFKTWGQAFPPDYRERVTPSAAVADIAKLASVGAASPLALLLYGSVQSDAEPPGLKLYRLGEPLVLSDSLPMLEHMGARVLAEASYRIQREDADPIWIHDFSLQAHGTSELPPHELARLFEDAFAGVLQGGVESDAFNRLVLRAGLPANDVVVLRAYARYLRQIGFAPSQSSMAATLVAYPAIARGLVTLFRLRLDPAHRDDTAAAVQTQALEQALQKVETLADDRILRQLLALVQATLRTNFWRTGVGASGEAGAARAFLSFKLDSARVPGLPLPKPLYEIFVYSPRFEGIHLRGGKVARGGLRWSDRPDDFRTEVLGLVKAQMVKNTVIVPVGSKGGFVLKKAPPAAAREAFMKEGVACYQNYLRGLLDLTDNLANGHVVAPPQVVRHDGDDPYLVVAADKGTATFSDYANQISAEYGHWLGDAFASGGSVGYDHKAMGITARGAWESVKRHFREMGVNTQATGFTVVGIGDMSGDVFGNGMLLSPHIRLVAAFDHRHVFLDPSPDPAQSLAERLRLFALPRSSWADYNAQLISAGGGVWARSEKSVPLSAPVRALLSIEAEQLTPTELISALLKAPVDLLYNGGIGTYVKASTESHADAGDRANDSLRVDGRDLRCKVVAEGGNLGFTQRGRIEAAATGVRINTDAIDNSAGVDTSDHEVNIKILLGLAVADGSLSAQERNALLPHMTDEVATLVLRDNYFQTQALSIDQRLGGQLLEQHARLIRFLEKQGRLDRAIEYLPNDEALAERRTRGQALTRPEQAVLLAYGKMWLHDEVLASDLPEDPWIATALARYFPQRLREHFSAQIPRHPLKREIIATHVVNSMVNRVGPAFAHRQGEITGAAPAQVVRAYLATREVFGLVATWQAIEALDNQVPDAVQADMVLALRGLIARGTTWFLRSRRLADPMEQVVGRFMPAVQALEADLRTQATQSEAAQRWAQAGVPAALAAQVAAVSEGLLGALDAAETAEATAQPVALAAEVQAAVGRRLGLDALRQQIAGLPAESFWQGLAQLALADDLADVQRAMAHQALAQAKGSTAAVLDQWEQRNQTPLERARRLLQELKDSGTAPDLATLTVALRVLRNVA